MNDTIAWVELARLPIAKMQDVLLARFLGRDVATKMGFAPATLTHLATAISEIARNVVQHAGCAGEIQMGRFAEGERHGLRIIVSDLGKGIAHPERFLEEGKFATQGAGVTGSRQLVDQFHIQSAPGMGTVVTMELWMKDLTI